MSNIQIEILTCIRIKMMYRETKDRTDSTGGMNIWNFGQVMNDLEYTVK